MQTSARSRRLILGLALASWPLFAHGQSLTDADAFVRKLYRAYERGGEPDYLGPQAGRVFSPRLLGLIRRDERLTPKGDVPELDGDPICDCQDPGGMTGLAVQLSGAGPGRAQARVRFRLDTEPRDLTLDLVAVRGRWLVDDVHSKDTPSLARFLATAHQRKRDPSRRG
jgi:hypothetical protein